MFAYSFVPLVCFVEVDSCFILSLLFSQESNWITCYLERKTFHPSIIRRWLQIFLFQDREHLLFSLSPEASDAKKKKDPQGPIENLCSNPKEKRAGTNEDAGNQLRESDR
jgi:hypothetical protein